MRIFISSLLILLFFVPFSFGQLQQKGMQTEFAFLSMYGGERTLVEGGHLSGGSGIGVGWGLGYSFDGRLSADFKGIFQLNGHFNNLDGFVARSKFNNRILELNARYLLPLTFLEGLGIRAGGGLGYCSPSQFRIVDDLNDYEYYADYGNRVGAQAEFELYFQPSPQAALTLGVRYQNYGRFKVDANDITHTSPLPAGLETTTHDRSSQGIGVKIAFMYLFEGKN